jgi:uncharacterized protein YoxC
MNRRQIISALAVVMLSGCENMVKTNDQMAQTNDNMDKTLTGMSEMNKGITRSNTLMTEMNGKLGVMTQVIQKIPGLMP